VGRVVSQTARMPPGTTALHGLTADRGRARRRRPPQRHQHEWPSGSRSTRPPSRQRARAWPSRSGGPAETRVGRCRRANRCIQVKSSGGTRRYASTSSFAWGPNSAARRAPARPLYRPPFPVAFSYRPRRGSGPLGRPMGPSRLRSTSARVTTDSRPAETSAAAISDRIAQPTPICVGHHQERERRGCNILAATALAALYRAHTEPPAPLARPPGQRGTAAPSGTPTGCSAERRDRSAGRGAMKNTGTTKPYAMASRAPVRRQRAARASWRRVPRQPMGMQWVRP